MIPLFQYLRTQFYDFDREDILIMHKNVTFATQL